MRLDSNYIEEKCKLRKKISFIETFSTSPTLLLHKQVISLRKYHVLPNEELSQKIEFGVAVHISTNILINEIELIFTNSNQTTELFTLEQFYADQSLIPIEKLNSLKQKKRLLLTTYNEQIDNLKNSVITSRIDRNNKINLLKKKLLELDIKKKVLEKRKKILLPHVLESEPYYDGSVFARSYAFRSINQNVKRPQDKGLAVDNEEQDKEKLTEFRLSYTIPEFEVNFQQEKLNRRIKALNPLYALLYYEYALTTNNTESQTMTLSKANTLKQLWLLSSIKYTQKLKNINFSSLTDFHILSRNNKNTLEHRFVKNHTNR